ncbi:hypothetical protein [Actinocatenispora thailandica]|nr:hypothetical protein [Actinocatenispora thailandica]
MDLVPDNVGRDGADGFNFHNSATGQPVPINGAAHRAADQAATEAVAAIDDPQVADHPLVQGLLAELPDRDARLPDGWLDRWLEAARAVLELLYTRR